jgi:hypothetical protein
VAVVEQLWSDVLAVGDRYRLRRELIGGRDPFHPERDSAVAVRERVRSSWWG